jgi:predicted alpha/beta-fold hydrolase
VTTFQPQWGFAGAHRQTLLGAWIRMQSSQPYERLWLESSHNDHIAVDWFADTPEASDPRAPVLFIVHGLAGSAQSSQVLALRRAMRQIPEWRVVGINLRGSVGPQLIPRLYHGGSSEDLDVAVRAVIQLWNRPVVLVGYSLGANILLKWLGEQGDALNPLVLGACAVGCPFELGKTAAHLEKSWLTRRYRTTLMKLLKQRAERVVEHFPGVLDAPRLRSAVSILDFDHCVTAPLHGYPSADHYYGHASARSWLKGIRRPTLLLSALDDPFMPSDSWPGPDEWDSAYVQAEFTQTGGHLGYIGKGFQPWLEQRITDYCLSLNP